MEKLANITTKLTLINIISDISYCLFTYGEKNLSIAKKEKDDIFYPTEYLPNLISCKVKIKAVDKFAIYIRKMQTSFL